MNTVLCSWWRTYADIVIVQMKHWQLIHGRNGQQSKAICHFHLSSERAHSFRRPFKNALKCTNSVSSSIDLLPNFCCGTQVVVGNFSETKLGKEAKHKARISSKPLRKRGNQRVDDRQKVTDPIGFSEWKFIWCVEFF